MKSKLAPVIFAAPLLIASYIALHPGVASAEPNRFGKPAPIQAGKYNVDPMHTSVGFEIKHMGIANVHGRFNKKSGTVNFDPKDLTKSSIEFSIEAASIDTGVEPRDNHLRSGDFFEVEKYPNITFKSTAIRKDGHGYVADGDLTIKDVTKKISIPFNSYGPINDPRAGSRVGVIADPITINRQDYNIAYNAKMENGASSIDDNVKIYLSVEATIVK